MQNTVRRSMITTFCAFVLFGVGYVAIGRIADPVAPFNAVGRLHPEVRVAFDIFTYGGVLAFLAVVLGGLPVLFAAVRRALPNGARGIFRLFVIRPKLALKLLGAALLIAVCFLSFLQATQSFFSPPLSPAACKAAGCIASQPPLLIALSLVAAVGATTLFVFVVLAIATSLSQAVLRSEFSDPMLRFSLIPVAIATIVMACATVATAFWIIRLWMVAPQFAASGAGLGDGQTLWAISIVLAMALASILSAAGLLNGLRASRSTLSIG